MLRKLLQTLWCALMASLPPLVVTSCAQAYTARRTSAMPNIATDSLPKLKRRRKHPTTPVSPLAKAESSEPASVPLSSLFDSPPAAHKSNTHSPCTEIISLPESLSGKEGEEVNIGDRFHSAEAFEDACERYGRAGHDKFEGRMKVITGAGGCARLEYGCEGGPRTSADGRCNWCCISLMAQQDEGV